MSLHYHGIEHYVIYWTEDRHQFYEHPSARKIIEFEGPGAYEQALDYLYQLRSAEKTRILNTAREKTPFLPDVPSPLNYKLAHILVWDETEPERSRTDLQT
ncbi:hypothetical protein [Anaerotalea alkaliphila]|uniref:Uncharacterized protein n=1 Tax=Anaerotalea alkaliphila TaxID=2662126 RepID=A0A7X5KN65_9FIRM|nr:hypothetical protein [Anaerotalea alkaliphila]NDL67709.1 hypothetical protein [Anaerotalea alkaliphila]